MQILTGLISRKYYSQYDPVRADWHRPAAVDGF